MIGSQLTALAVPWFVLEMTGSASQTGIAEFFAAIAVAWAAFFGGAVVDRLGFKPSSIVADITSGACIAMVPLFHMTLGLSFWQLLLFVFLGNLLNVPGNTSRNALLPDLAVAAGMRMERAAAALQSVDRGARLVGAPVAGLLIATLGATNVLWIDAASFAASALIIGSMVQVTRRQSASTKEEGIRIGFLEGVHFIRKDKLILAIVLTVMVMNFVDSSFGGVVLPVYAKRVFGNAFDMGLILAALGGGSLVGAVVFGAVGHHLPRRAVFFVGITVLGLSYWVLSLLLPLSGFILVEAVVGLAAGPLNPIIGTIEYERIPAEMRGRVFGAITAGAYAAVPLGMLAAGFLIEWIDIRFTIMIMGGIYLAVLLSLALNPALRDMSRSPE